MAAGRAAGPCTAAESSTGTNVTTCAADDSIIPDAESWNNAMWGVSVIDSTSSIERKVLFEVFEEILIELRDASQGTNMLSAG